MDDRGQSVETSRRGGFDSAGIATFVRMTVGTMRVHLDSDRAVSTLAAVPYTIFGATDGTRGDF